VIDPLEVIAARQAQTNELLQELLHELRRANERDRLLEVLQAIAAATPGRAWNTVELVSRARGDVFMPAWERVARALGAVTDIGHKEAPRRLGKYLQRVQGIEVAGLRLERAGADRDGAIWMVQLRE
jgi:hypothetical protein